MATNITAGTITMDSPDIRFINWTIPDFFSRATCPIDYFEDSPTFEFQGATWCFRLYPNGREKFDSEGYLDISIVRSQSRIQSHSIACGFAIKHIFQRHTQEYSNILNFNEDCEKLAAIKFAKRSRLFTKSHRISSKAVLTIKCYMLSHLSTGMDAVLQQEHSDVKILSRDYKNLLLNGQDTDLTLKVGNREFRVHRGILRTRSHVFEAMLSHDMIEKETGVVNIPDCDPQAMEQFLFYVYCGKVETMDQSNMMDLYYIADKYYMMILKQECRDFIKKSLSPAITLDIIKFALKYNDADVLECATEYFVNNASDILATAKWTSFWNENVKAANDLLIKLTNKRWTVAHGKRKWGFL